METNFNVRVFCELAVNNKLHGEIPAFVLVGNDLASKLMAVSGAASLFTGEGERLGPLCAETGVHSPRLTLPVSP